MYIYRLYYCENLFGREVGTYQGENVVGYKGHFEDGGEILTMHDRVTINNQSYSVLHDTKIHSSV